VSADPSLLVLVHDSSEARVTVTAPLVHRCPHVPEVDVGTVTIGWRCTDVTLELHALVAYLATWHDHEVSHEELTVQIRRDLVSLDGLDDVTVSSRWTTAGCAVVVES
jgi:NADPH-dependent 7-cyano-7-deazaguanine reductase QueF